MRLQNYEIIDKLYESNLSIVYRAKRKSDKRQIIIKILNEDYPSKEKLVRFNYEYEMLKSFDTDNVIGTYSFEQYGNSAAIIEEDFGGKPLNEYDWKLLDLSDKLKLFIRIAEIVEEIHKKNIIHKDISPSNILWNSETDKLKIIDFGISTRLSQEKSGVVNPDTLEGKLAYISPEQTGRMNRTVDYRSDFYSLGATFYEVLTEKHPFSDATDEMELVHCHLAKRPIPPHEINNDVPAILSEIVLKLMAKNAENRYQSTFGLKADLQRCLDQILNEGKIDSFKLCRDDQLNNFQIPQKLYGREKEIEILLNGFERVCEGRAKLMFVSGYAGIGKSVLVNEIHKPIVKQRGYFISGKYDQFQKNTPYSAFIDAFQDLMQHLLTKSSEKLELWKEKLLKALGPNGQIIIDVIPQFELIIGKQKPVQKLPPTESQNRFNLVFQNFIQTIATGKHPLVIFLDDLQWADNASLELIEILMNSQENRYLFLIGSYRDNEVDKSHPLSLTINNIENEGVSIDNIKLKPLNIEKINQLIIDSLNLSSEKTLSLAELILAKTEGNPFFINEFLKLLHSKQLITFDYNSLSWEWELSKIKQTAITDNVVDLMAGKIKNLTQKTQDILKLAACIGNNFDLKTLSIIYKNSKAETASKLWEALQEYLILPIDDSYKFTNDLENVNPRYKFLHDRIQQAAYSLIPDELKKELHLQIGQLLLEYISEENLEEEIFTFVNHLNLAKELIVIDSEIIELARFNLIAGKKAKNSAAYAPSFNYIKTGINLLKENSWENEYNLCLELYIEGAEVAYLNGDFDLMKQYADIVMERANTSVIKAEIYDIQVRTFIAKNNPAEAIKTALEALNLLGVNIPEQPSEADIGQGLMSTQAIWADRKIEDLINLPVMTDPNKLSAMQLISTVMPITYVAAPTLVPMLAFAMVDLSVNFGNAPASTFGYATYGLVLCGSVGDIDSGYKFGELALNLLEELEVEEYKSRTYFYVYLFISHWKQHLRKSLNPALEAYKSGLETGDITNSTLNAMLYCHHAYIAGKELLVVADEMEEYSRTMAKLKQDFAFSYNELYKYAVLSWIKEGKDNKPYYEEYYQKMLPILQETQNISAIWIIYLNKTIFDYVFQRYIKAHETAVQAEQFIAAATGAITPPLFYFYDSLIRLAIYPDAKESEKEEMMKKIEENQEKIKNWANHAPMNFLHKWTLVEAEKARVLDENVQAEKYYDEAIDLAQKNEYINEEALAYELTSRYYFAKDKTRIAAYYMREAHYAYQRWGAAVKVKKLEENYSKSLSPLGMKHTKSSTITNTSIANTTGTTTLDLTSVLKASQNISGEIELKSLLEKMMKVIIENAGAQKGFLILENSGQWFIEAEGVIEKTSEKFSTEELHSVPLINNRKISEGIVRYVIRTNENVVLNDASQEGFFIQDKYIIQNKPKSIICAPLINQGKLSGIIYLENNLTTGAFTEDRLQVLNLLSSQAAISVENARMYEELAEMNETLEEKVQEKTEGIKNLLDNAGQGFLKFREDLIVDDEYSLECENILNEKPTEKNILNLLNIDHKEKESMEMILTEIFGKDGKNPNSKIAVYISLLPEEVKINGKVVKIEYKVFADNKNSRSIMMILTDITEKIELENKMRQEKENLKLIVKIASNKKGFMESIREYEEFCNNTLNKYLENITSKNLSELHRIIHTFKGDFAQWHMNNTVDSLHLIEDKLIEISENSDGIKNEIVKKIFADFDFYKSIEDDLKIIEEYLGKDYIDISEEDEYFRIERSKILDIEKKIIDLNRKDLEEILQEVRELRYTEFKEMLLTYPEYSIELANRLQKKINPFKIGGGDFLVEKEKYRRVTKPLIHIFRNMVDHGIENEDIRIELNKDEFGNISCNIEKLNNKIVIRIKDDGIGIDFDKIKNKLVNLGKYSVDEIEGVDENALIDSLFLDDFSTKDEVSTVSGRGVGLSEVKHEVERLNGSIEVKTERNKGTEFTIKIPVL